MALERLGSTPSNGSTSLICTTVSHGRRRPDWVPVQAFGPLIRSFDLIIPRPSYRSRRNCLDSIPRPLLLAEVVQQIGLEGTWTTVGKQSGFNCPYWCWIPLSSCSSFPACQVRELSTPPSPPPFSFAASSRVQWAPPDPTADPSPEHDQAPSAAKQPQDVQCSNEYTLNNRLDVQRGVEFGVPLEDDFSGSPSGHFPKASRTAVQEIMTLIDPS